MKSWLREHAYALAAAVSHVRRPRGGFLLNVLVIAIALTLPLLGLTVLENLRPLSQQLAVEPEVSVFLAMQTSRDQAVALRQEIESALQSANMHGKPEFIPREKALAALDDKTSLGAAVAALESNPLPDAYVVKLAGFKNVEEVGQLDALVARMRELPGVEQVQIDSDWIKRLTALLQVLRLALLLLAMTLGVVVVAVVFNTIRLQVLNQREEIEVCKLLGATDRFVYRPFYYAGAFLGLCAGLLALLLVFGGLYPINQAVAGIAKLYGSTFRLLPLDAPLSLLLVGASALLGLCGAVLSVKRSLIRLK
jgi:cell division transport system permease protein